MRGWLLVIAAATLHMALVDWDRAIKLGDTPLLPVYYAGKSRSGFAPAADVLMVAVDSHCIGSFTCLILGFALPVGLIAAVPRAVTRGLELIAFCTIVIALGSPLISACIVLVCASLLWYVLRIVFPADATPSSSTPQ